MKHIRKSAGASEGRRGLGKLISCYSASQCLALNFDVMAEAREALATVKQQDKEPHAKEGRVGKQKQLQSYSDIFKKCS